MGGAAPRTQRGGSARSGWCWVAPRAPHRAMAVPVASAGGPKAWPGPRPLAHAASALGEGCGPPAARLDPSPVAPPAEDAKPPPSADGSPMHGWRRLRLSSAKRVYLCRWWWWWWRARAGTVWGPDGGLLHEPAGSRGLQAVPTRYNERGPCLRAGASDGPWHAPTRRRTQKKNSTPCSSKI